MNVQNAIAAGVVTLLFVSANAVDESTSPSALDAEVGLILDQPLPESEYSKPIRCLSFNAYRSVEVLDARHLLFLGSRDRVWLNQLRADCAGLKSSQLLRFDVSGSRVCALDRFQGLDRLGGMAGASTSCGLQSFELITVQQADQLRQWLAQPRKSRGKSPLRESEPANG